MDIPQHFSSSSKTITGKSTLVFFLLLLACITFALKFLYGLPGKESLSWYLGTFICFYIPGSLLLRIVQEKEHDFFIHIVLSLGLGLALTPILYLFARRFGQPELLLFAGLIFIGAWISSAVHDFKSGRFLLRATTLQDLLYVTALLIFLFLLLHLSHFTDLILLDQGVTIRNSYLTETIFHLGIINSLTDTFPPPALYASGGADFSYYHLNMHLAIELLNRFFSLSTASLTFFYFPFLFFSLLAFLPYVFFSRFWNLKFLGALCGILMFGSDLSFIPGLINSSSSVTPWTLYFPSTIWSLFTLNGNLPAISTLLLCVFFLHLYFDRYQTRILVLTGLLGYAAFGLKSSMGLHIMAVIFITGLVLCLQKQGRPAGLKLCITAALSLLIMFADMKIWHATSGSFTLSMDLFNQFFHSLQMIIPGRIPTLLLPFFFLGYILATFSVRIFSLYLLKFLSQERRIDPTLTFLLLFGFTGFLLSESTTLNNLTATNNSVWFTIQGLTGGWLLFGLFLKQIRGQKWLFVAAAITAILLATPTTAQFLMLRYDKNYFLIDKNGTEVVHFLKATAPDSVILHLPNTSGPSLASNMAGRSSVINSFRSFVGIKDNAPQRLQDVLAFFSQYTSFHQKNAILKKYGVDYVYAPIDYRFVLSRLATLHPVVQNDEFIVYRVQL